MCLFCLEHNLAGNTMLVNAIFLCYIPGFQHFRDLQNDPYNTNSSFSTEHNLAGNTILV